ncbi:MAG: hypothetical protein AVDCRST_MAG49-1149 [uncultured Thermomicrobiales bacterium]|uniref:Uncharacterized protein n=1 Tax=uncultured Thermomicrobiales bacterium TaxID=1645740 RepID=A0A6J4UAV3_9BACT|nr:MAG: hypothetical protein AVDCRST_MAG49-1149 [uncultured Thermomicrobiales bacterium]
MGRQAAVCRDHSNARTTEDRQRFPTASTDRRDDVGLVRVAS